MKGSAIDLAKVSRIRIYCKRCGAESVRPLCESHELFDGMRCKACGETTANKLFLKSLDKLVKIVYELDGTSNGPKVEVLT